jgi:hypothetical protein
MNSALEISTSTSKIFRHILDILDTIGHTGFVMSNERYAELLSETIKAMEDRLEAVNTQRVAHIAEAGRLQDEMNAMRADIEALTAVWNRTPSRGKEMVETKPLASVKGFTVAIEYVLKALGTKMSPPEIRDKMTEWGYDTGKYTTNLVASIHSVLRRLVAKGSIQEITDGEKRKSYQWIKDSERLTQILS